jgi:hypothetical protein
MEENNETERLAWFNANNLISIATLDLNKSLSLEFFDCGDFIQIDIMTAIKLRTQLTMAIQDAIDTMNEELGK